MPFVRPLTTIGLATPVAVNAPGEDVTVYPVTAEPPSETGAVNETEASVFPAVADTIVGASGTVAGVAAADAVEGSESPAEFVATIVNVYATPFVNPLTTMGLATPEAVMSSGDDVTV